MALIGLLLPMEGHRTLQIDTEMIALGRHNLTLVIEFTLGALLFFVGLRAKKMSAERNAVILSIYMAATFMTIFSLSIITDVLRPSIWLRQKIEVLNCILAGMALGFYIIMVSFGYTKTLFKRVTGSNAGAKEIPERKDY
jgi:hypothetical protein